MTKRRRILLTGVSGYIGRNLAPALTGKGHLVVGLDREPRPQGLELEDFIQCDLLDVDLYQDALDDLDLICHLAAAKGDWGITDGEYFRDNLGATAALHAAALGRGVKDWVFYSTVSVHGPSDVSVTEDAPFRPINAYGKSKVECERLLRAHARANPDATVIVIRPSVVFGPGNPRNTNIYRLIDAIWRRRFVMIGDGTPVKTTSYITNLVAAHLFLMDWADNGSHRGFDAFCYVDEPALETGELVNRLATLLDRCPAARLPLGFAARVARVADRVGEILGLDLPITSARIRKFCTATRFSSEKIRDLGFEQPVDLDSMLQTTVKWHTGSRDERAWHPSESGSGLGGTCDDQ